MTVFGKELPPAISAWAEETFGHAGSDLRVCARALEEMAELARKCATSRMRGDASVGMEEVREEAADVVIVLARLAERCGWDVADEIERVAWQNEPAVPDAMYLVGNAQVDLAKAFAHLADGGFRRRAKARACVAATILNLAWAVERTGEDATLGASIDAKMAINRARTWTLDGTGHGYHRVPDCNLALPGWPTDLTWRDVLDCKGTGRSLPRSSLLPRKRQPTLALQATFARAAGYLYFLGHDGGLWKVTEGGYEVVPPVAVR